MPNTCEKVFTLNTAPTGMQLARRFPWWATAYQQITVNTQIDDKFVFRAPQGNRQAFANDKPWPVYIDEIRFWATCESQTPENIWSTLRRWLTECICLKIKTDLQQNLVSKWMPAPCFCTSPGLELLGTRPEMTWTLPAPYYLPFGSQFSVEIDSSYLPWREQVMQCSLQGCDPNNQTPYAILSTPTTTVDGTATPAPGRLVLAFDDNRDRPVRNMWVDKFMACMMSAQVAATPVDTSYDPWQNLEIKFNPPEGPSWTSDITTPMVAFADRVHWQPRPLYSSNPIIHKPIKPYILRPGDAMTIELQVRYDPTADPSNRPSHRIYAHVRGWQPGEGI